MKVGTDGVLLGAWSNIREGNILDIGSGTGLISLMLAQRTTTALIDAVEIETEAYNQTLENIKNSNWSSKITAMKSSIQEYYPNKEYDLIISNPPFFIDSTKAPSSKRNIARHTDELSYSDLIESINRLLKPTGILSIILPITEAEQFIELAAVQNLLLNKECVVKPNSTKPSKRMLLEFSYTNSEIIKEELTIETKTRHQYTKEYISLTKDFYLNF